MGIDGESMRGAQEEEEANDDELVSRTTHRHTHAHTNGSKWGLGDETAF